MTCSISFGGRSESNGKLSKAAIDMKTFKQLQLNLRHCLNSFLQSSNIGRLSIFQDPLDFSKVRRLHLVGNKAQNLLKKGAQYYLIEKKKKAISLKINSQ